MMLHEQCEEQRAGSGALIGSFSLYSAPSLLASWDLELQLALSVLFHQRLGQTWRCVVAACFLDQVEIGTVKRFADVHFGNIQALSCCSRSCNDPMDDEEKICSLPAWSKASHFKEKVIFQIGFGPGQECELDHILQMIRHCNAAPLGCGSAVLSFRDEGDIGIILGIFFGFFTLQSMLHRRHQACGNRLRNVFHHGIGGAVRTWGASASFHVRQGCFEVSEGELCQDDGVIFGMGFSLLPQCWPQYCLSRLCPAVS